jgi:hypothetical protein
LRTVEFPGVELVGDVVTPPDDLDTDPDVRDAGTGQVHHCFDVERSLLMDQVSTGRVGRQARGDSAVRDHHPSAVETQVSRDRKPAEQRASGSQNDVVTSRSNSLYGACRYQGNVHSGV